MDKELLGNVVITVVNVRVTLQINVKDASKKMLVASVMPVIVQ